MSKFSERNFSGIELLQATNFFPCLYGMFNSIEKKSSLILLKFHDSSLVFKKCLILSIIEILFCFSRLNFLSNSHKLLTV